MNDPALVPRVEKLAELGHQAGFSVEEMLRILNGGFTIQELLEVIEVRLEKQRKAMIDTAQSPR